ncbi:MAG: Ku protein [Pseudomonadota bacterium]
MAARALASASIAFGLVSIPVKLFAAVDSTHAVRFNQIHSKDGSRIKHQTVSAKTGEPVPRSEIVKGYEFSKDQYVLFSPEELKALEATADQMIDVVEFIEASQVDHLMVDKAYYLGPDKGGARAYSLLAAALRKTGRAAIARYAARGRQHLVMVRPFEDGLMLEQLHYAQELRRFSDLEVETAEVRDGELDLAVQLIEQSASERFEPEKYKDEVRERMLDLIQRKVDGEDISVTPAEHADDKIIDIMEALKASIASRDGEEGQSRKPARKSPAAKKATTRKKKKASTSSSSPTTRKRKVAAGER